MTECLVIPFANSPQILGPAPAEQAPDAEGAPAEFNIEEVLPEVPEEMPEDHAPPVAGPAADPLQLLIEELSGISGALREAAPLPADQDPALKIDIEMCDPAPQEVLPVATEVPAETEVAAAYPDPGPADMTATAIGPLQTLVKDSTGNTNAPRKAAPPAQGDAPAVKMELAASDPAPQRISPAILDMPSGIKMAAASFDLTNADSAGPAIDSLQADSAAVLAPAPAPQAEAAFAAELRQVRPTVPAIVRQVAEAVVTARDDVIEIALAPEELGKIRMVMSTSEHNPHVTIWVERPEVLDQLRRNATILQECLGDAGMADASFEFQGDTRSGSGGERSARMPADRPGFEVTEHVQVIPLTWTPMAIPARLDIRI